MELYGLVKRLDMVKPKERNNQKTIIYTRSKSMSHKSPSNVLLQ